VALTGIRYSEALLPLHPGSAPEPVRPASFSHIKALQRSPIRYPVPDLQPAKLISGATAPAPDAKATPKTAQRTSARAAAARAAGAAVPAPPMTTPWEEARRDSLSGTRSEPLWHSLFSPDSKLRLGEPKTDSRDKLAPRAATVR